MIGSKYAVDVEQLEDHGALHPYAHIFLRKVYKKEYPDIIAEIMTQISLKAGFKKWVTKSNKAVK